MPDDVAPHATALHDLTIAEASRLIAARRLSPVELTRALLERIDALDPQLNAYLLVTADQALAQARAAEAEVMAGNQRGPMFGIPFALKDIYCTKGIRTTCHSRTRAGYVPDFDATTVARLHTLAPFSSASLPRTSSPMAARPSICRGHRRAIRGTRSTSPADPPAAPAPALPPVWQWVPSAPTLAAPSATRRRCAAWSG